VLYVQDAYDGASWSLPESTSPHERNSTKPALNSLREPLFSNILLPCLLSPLVYFFRLENACGGGLEGQLSGELLRSGATHQP
jgi:hypothetical protein